MKTLENASNTDQDPDYASLVPSDQIHQIAHEKSARVNTIKKISAVLEKEFTKEINLKEKEVGNIQRHLDEALKIFHHLRYVIVHNFYNRKKCELPESISSKQSRIHPAVKQLIGKHPPSSSTYSALAGESYDSENSRLLISENATGKTFDSDNQSIDGTVTRPQSNSIHEEPPRKLPRYIPPKSTIPDPPNPSRGLHHKVRKRIIVGNISKWIPPDWREDAASHKWTMYVRGSDGNADIKDYVTKIRFFLHPSYRPNDVVEITSPPFHLSRRGWGEFPLRVQLHFKNPLNKPIDIIHHLKLDRTYTGLQTLGTHKTY